MFCFQLGSLGLPEQSNSGVGNLPTFDIISFPHNSHSQAWNSCHGTLPPPSCIFLKPSSLSSRHLEERTSICEERRKMGTSIKKSGEMIMLLKPLSRMTELIMQVLSALVIETLNGRVRRGLRLLSSSPWTWRRISSTICTWQVVVQLSLKDGHSSQCSQFHLGRALTVKIFLLLSSL